MTIPTIHLNGTGKDTLLEELRTAHAALSVALETLHNVTVHGRDFYVQGPDAYGTAREEMNARLDAVRNVRDDVLALYQAIDAQGKNRGIGR